MSSSGRSAVRLRDGFGEHREQSFERAFGRQVGRDGVAIDAGQVGQPRFVRREHERAVAQQPAGRRFAALDAVIGDALEERPERMQRRRAAHAAVRHQNGSHAPVTTRKPWSKAKRVAAVASDVLPTPLSPPIMTHRP